MGTIEVYEEIKNLSSGQGLISAWHPLGEEESALMSLSNE